MQCNMWDEKKYTIKNVHEFTAHTGGCYTIAFDPSEKKTHFAIGSADSLVSILEYSRRVHVFEDCGETRDTGEDGCI